MLILVTIGMVAVLGMAGLALDLGLAYIAKSKLQNALDSAALSSARVLNLGLGTAAASAEATRVFNLANTGATLTFKVGDYLPPFSSPGISNKFVKLSVTGQTVPTYFANIFGIGSLPFGGSAVAGPVGVTGPTCGAIPIAICSNDSTSTDTDCSDGQCFGIGSVGNSEMDIKGGGVGAGSGNYGLVDIGNNSDLEAGLGGTKDVCFTQNENRTTKTGSTSGAMDGLETRFEAVHGFDQTDYPQDIVGTTDTESLYPAPLVQSYTAYQALLLTGGNQSGTPQRRLVLTAVVNCDAAKGGKTDVTVMGSVCLFLTRKLDKKNGDVYAQMATDGCRAAGSGTTGGSTGNGYIIVLYQSSGAS